MPTYEYACGACGHAWEEVQRITEPPVELCPSCKQASAHRLISGGTNFILKGGGWYSDLYASPKPAAKKADEGSAGAGTTDSTKPAAASSEGAKPSSDATASTSSPSSGGSSGTSSKPTSAPAAT